MQISPLVSADLGDAFALSEAEGWNQTEADWRRLLQLEPLGCFAARDGRELIGTVTTTTYARELAWIGMMIVHRDARGQGIGAALMHMALAYLQDRGISDVRLDATPAGRPLYESLGFIMESEFERWHGVARAPKVATLAQQNEASIESILSLDQAAYGADRSGLLERLLAESVAKGLLADRRRHASGGYALARPGRITTYVGPIVAQTLEDAERVLDAVLAQVAGDDVCLDLHLGGCLQPKQLTVRGWSKRRVLTRMRHGHQTAYPTTPVICASAGPEYG